jgi:hypothetical protein
MFRASSVGHHQASASVGVFFNVLLNKTGTHRTSIKNDFMWNISSELEVFVVAVVSIVVVLIVVVIIMVVVIVVVTAAASAPACIAHYVTRARQRAVCEQFPFILLTFGQFPIFPFTIVLHATCSHQSFCHIKRCLCLIVMYLAT